MNSEVTDTNTQLFRTTDAADPEALARLEPERSALVVELTSRRRDGHLALENDLAGEVTTRLVPPVVTSALPPKVGRLGRALTALRRWAAW